MRSTIASPAQTRPSGKIGLVGSVGREVVIREKFQTIQDRLVQLAELVRRMPIDLRFDICPIGTRSSSRLSLSSSIGFSVQRYLVSDLTESGSRVNAKG